MSWLELQAEANLHQPGSETPGKQECAPHRSAGLSSPAQQLGPLEHTCPRARHDWMVLLGLAPPQRLTVGGMRGGPMKRQRCVLERESVSGEEHL
jgi:hypothetical protein